MNLNICATTISESIKEGSSAIVEAINKLKISDDKENTQYNNEDWNYEFLEY